MSYQFNIPKYTLEELQAMQPEFTSAYQEWQYTEPYTDKEYWLDPPDMSDHNEDGVTEFNEKELEYIKRIKTEYGDYIDLNTLRNAVLGSPDFVEIYREIELYLLAWYCEQAKLLKNAKKNGVKPSALLDIYDDKLPLKSKTKDSNLGRLKKLVRRDYILTGLKAMQESSNE